MHGCQCLPYWQLTCEGNDTFIDSGYISTYSKNSRLLSVIVAKKYGAFGGYNTTKPGYIMLPKKISRLNEYMCGPLNRKGHLCGECSDGYGPSMILTGCTDMCYNCTKPWYGMTLYLSLEFVPITVFYLFILAFQISVTSAPMTCFIMYSQLIVIAFHNSCDSSLLSQVQFTETGALRSVSKVFLTFYEVLNLDFFCHAVPPFCISSQLKPIHIALLGYVSALYPFVLIILTWLCVEFHDRNFRLIVHLWKPFHRCFVRLRRGWNTKSDLIDVFASFFLLSYGKVIYQTLLLFDTDGVYNYSLTGDSVSYDYVLSADISIMIGSAKYVGIAITTGLIFCAFSLLPVLLLVLFPIKKFRVVLSKLRLDGIALNIFVEKFHCCYRDGLDGGRDTRSFSGLYFLLRLMVLLVDYLNKSTLRLEVWFFSRIGPFNHCSTYCFMQTI